MKLVILPFRPVWARFALPLLIVGLLVVAGCDIVDTREGEDAAEGRRALVGNQGDFVAGNGSVSRYEPARNASAVAIRDLESIVQSIEVYDGRLFVAANTGERIDVFGVQTEERLGTIEGLVSPRYMAFVGDRMFVTNLYGGPGVYHGGTVSVIDLDSYEVTEEIEVGDNPEGIAAVGNRLFVANQGFGSGSSVSVIDAGTMEVIETVDVECDGPRFVVPDDDGDVFVFCTGQVLYDDAYQEVGSTAGAIRVLDASSGAVTGRIDVEGRMMSAEFGQDAYYDATSRRIFALRNDASGGFHVTVIDTRSNEVIDSIGPFEGQIGAVAYDPTEAVLYLGEIRGFTQSGRVGMYDLDGELVRRFTSGVAPTSIRFVDVEP